jgi:hypothetical protein
MSDETDTPVRLQQAEAYASLLEISRDERIPPKRRISAARSVLQFSTPSYFTPPAPVDDD